MQSRRQPSIFAPYIKHLYRFTHIPLMTQPINQNIINPHTQFHISITNSNKIIKSFQKLILLVKSFKNHGTSSITKHAILTTNKSIKKLYSII
ncbi:hypothetical protein OIU74_005784 [Salix koriyanagi]|uniref:Uncharacterized protein n=1 Tax=Salix koriyanagi TaxID=2511006 RepID=A0A9Q0NWX1_9ROSI|nr:hypothetical protein OIU74_005784 [Salix koriyanagi]